jgi:hypothetical protein
MSNERERILKAANFAEIDLLFCHSHGETAQPLWGQQNTSPLPNTKQNPGILWPRKLGVTRVRTARTECVQVSQRLRDAVRRTRRQAAGRGRGRGSGSAPSHESLVPPYSPNLAVPYSENVTRGGAIKTNATAELRRFWKQPSAGASSKGRIDGASLCVRARVPLWRCLNKRCCPSQHCSAMPSSRGLTDRPSFCKGSVYYYYSVSDYIGNHLSTLHNGVAEDNC